MGVAKAAVVLGLLLLASGFGLGVEPTYASGNPPGYSCGTAISSQALVSGTTPSPTPAASGTQQERRVELRCASARHRTGWLAWGGMAAGFAIFLVGWTALREWGRGLATMPGQPTPA